MKRLSALLLVVVSVLFMVIPANATEAEVIQPRYENIARIGAGCSIDGNGIATCVGSVKTYKALNVKVVCSLQRLEGSTWRTIKSWTETGTMAVLISQNWAVMSGYEYRSYVVAYVYDVSGKVIETAVCIDYV